MGYSADASAPAGRPTSSRLVAAFAVLATVTFLSFAAFSPETHRVWQVKQEADASGETYSALVQKIEKTKARLAEATTNNNEKLIKSLQYGLDNMLKIQTNVEHAKARIGNASAVGNAGLAGSLQKGLDKMMTKLQPKQAVTSTEAPAQMSNIDHARARIAAATAAGNTKLAASLQHGYAKMLEDVPVAAQDGGKAFIGDMFSGGDELSPTVSGAAAPAAPLAANAAAMTAAAMDPVPMVGRPVAAAPIIPTAERIATREAELSAQLEAETAAIDAKTPPPDDDLCLFDPHWILTHVPSLRPCLLDSTAVALMDSSVCEDVP